MRAGNGQIIGFCRDKPDKLIGTDTTNRKGVRLTVCVYVARLVATVEVQAVRIGTTLRIRPVVSVGALIE